ncbi:hypothetical protein [Aeromonas salmonicida]|uniref:hypothetical protein n=1 Tax=Aeromonas salmonicida TaxID=645 RepID=UPI003D31924B
MCKRDSPNPEAVLHSIPRLDTEGEELPTIPGNPPNLLRLPTGCPSRSPSTGVAGSAL